MKFKRIFFPARCVQCGKVIGVNEEMCERCARTFIRIERPSCPHCGQSREDCICDTEAYYFPFYAAAFRYDGVAADMLRQMKFDGKKEYAYYFAKQLAQTIVTQFPDVNFDMVIGVPMTEADEKARGYNQSELLAKHTARLLSVHFSNSAVIKIRQTQHQHTLDSNQRKTNLLGAFLVNRAEINNKTILLCDDIRTTGSTLYYIMDELLSNGAKRVYCVTAALV